MTQKEKNRMQVKQITERAVQRDEQNKRIHFAAAHPLKENFKKMGTSLGGLSEDDVFMMRGRYGNNKVTREKRKSLAQRLAGAFINPFTAILFCLTLVSTITDRVFPAMQRKDSLL